MCKPGLYMIVLQLWNHVTQEVSVMDPDKYISDKPKAIFLMYF